MGENKGVKTSEQMKIGIKSLFDDLQTIISYQINNLMFQGF